MIDLVLKAVEESFCGECKSSGNACPFDGNANPRCEEFASVVMAARLGARAVLEQVQGEDIWKLGGILRDSIAELTPSKAVCGKCKAPWTNKTNAPCPSCGSRIIFVL